MPLPASLTQITLTGTFFNEDGTFATGTVSIQMPVYLQSSGDDAFVAPFIKTIQLVNGAFSETLPATDDPQWVPINFVYRVTVNTSVNSSNYGTTTGFISLPWTGPSTVDLADVFPAPSPLPTPVSYVLLSSVGQVGGPAGPLDALGKMPLAQLPAHAATHASAGSDPVTLAQSQVTNLTTDLAAKQPLDTDLTTIAGLAPPDDDVIQRKAGAWTARTMAQVKTDLVLVKSDVGLGNVDNVSDVNKPISTATQTALTNIITSVTPTAFTAPSYAANAANDVVDGHATAGSRTVPVLGIVQMQGEVALTATFNSGVTFATLPVGHRPTATLVSLSIRTSGTGATGSFLDITSAGAMSIRTTLNSGAKVILDGLSFVL